MTSNRLYIVDTENGDAFMLCKSYGEGWGIFNSGFGDELDLWLADRDGDAQAGGDYSKFKLVTESGSNIDSVAVCENKERTG